MTATTTLSTAQGLHYGLLGMPLAFVALPLYVLLPHHYASQYGMPLATLGAVLLAATRRSAAASSPGARRLRWWAWYSPPCCHRWQG